MAPRVAKDSRPQDSGTQIESTFWFASANLAHVRTCCIESNGPKLYPTLKPVMKPWPVVHWPPLQYLCVNQLISKIHSCILLPLAFLPLPAQAGQSLLCCHYLVGT